jgi:predicted RND superfamily exporter protein
MYEAGAAVPGVILEYMDLEARRANFVVFFKDVTGPTVDSAVREAKIFLDAHPIEGVKYRFAGGIVGTTAAANQEVERSELLQTILIVVVVCLSVMLTYRSVTAALLVFAVLFLAVLINRAYMGMRGIGLNVNTLPVTAVGIGIGVDYAIYILDRIREEVRDKPLDLAISTTLSTTGSAVFFTAVTVIAGIAYWIPGSALRFNSEMAMLLSLLMLSNMIGSVTLLPLLVRIFKPSFVTGNKYEPSKEEKEPLAVSETKSSA